MLEAHFLNLDLNGAFDVVLALGLFDYLREPLRAAEWLRARCSSTLVASFTRWDWVKGPAAAPRVRRLQRSRPRLHRGGRGVDLLLRRRASGRVDVAQLRGARGFHVRRRPSGEPMRVALVQPPPRSEFDRHWARFPGLGIAYVASSLRAAGHEVELLDGKLAYLDVDEIVERVRAAQPDLVGITCMTVEFPRAVEIARRIKDDRPGRAVVVGGAHVNAVGRQALEEGTGFDFACVGEGEYLACELADALECSAEPRASQDSCPGTAARS